jgi:opacity protein-like surface antigen
MLLIVICSLSAFAFSQAVASASSPLSVHLPSVPNGEVYGGFQWENFDTHNFLGLPAGATTPRTNFPGFHTSASFALHRWLEVEGDLGHSSEYYKSFFVTNDNLFISTLTILAGPRVRYQLGPLTQFAHVLVGVDHLSSRYTTPTPVSTTSNSTNPFTLAIGGGTSFKVSRFFGIETTADYIRASTSGAPLNDIRISVGPVLYFGGAKAVPAAYTPPPAPAAPPRVATTVPPRPPVCIEYLVDHDGNEWCLVHAGQH